MSEVLLPIAPSPLTSFQYLAYSLAVLFNYPECLPWFYNNFIQLEYFKDKNGETLSFVGGWMRDIACFEDQWLNKLEFVANTVNISNSIKDYLNQGWYFYSVFDEFYVPTRTRFNQVHFTYDFLLYGYHDEEQNYSILGYTDRGILEATKISYVNFMNAFESTPESAYDYVPCVIVYRKREDFLWEFDLVYLQEMLSDYLHSRDTATRLKLIQRDTMKNRIFGLRTYDCFTEYFQLIIDQQVKRKWSLYRSARSLHVLWEHKKCMLSRLEYLNQIRVIERFDYFYGFYQKLENDCLILRNSLVKYSLKEDPQILEKIMKSLQEIKQQESVIIEEMLEVIQKKLKFI
jgi:hypothetical protein